MGALRLSKPDSSVLLLSTIGETFDSQRSGLVKPLDELWPDAGEIR